MPEFNIFLPKASLTLSFKDLTVINPQRVSRFLTVQQHIIGCSVHVKVDTKTVSNKRTALFS